MWHNAIPIWEKKKKMVGKGVNSNSGVGRKPFSFYSFPARPQSQGRSWAGQQLKENASEFLLSFSLSYFVSSRALPMEGISLKWNFKTFWVHIYFWTTTHKAVQSTQREDLENVLEFQCHDHWEWQRRNCGPTVHLTLSKFWLHFHYFHFPGKELEVESKRAYGKEQGVESHPPFFFGYKMKQAIQKTQGHLLKATKTGIVLGIGERECVELK